MSLELASASDCVITADDVGDSFVFYEDFISFEDDTPFSTVKY